MEIQVVEDGLRVELGADAIPFIAEPSGKFVGALGEVQRVAHHAIAQGVDGEAVDGKESAAIVVRKRDGECPGGPLRRHARVQ